MAKSEETIVQIHLEEQAKIQETRCYAIFLITSFTIITFLCILYGTLVYFNKI